MDINCISQCRHQKEGKCSLTELGAASRISMGNPIYPPDASNINACLYFAKK